MDAVARSVDDAFVLDLLANAVLTLSRDAIRLVDDEQPWPSWLADAVDRLATAARTLATDLDDDRAVVRAREQVLAAVARPVAAPGGMREPRAAGLAADLRVAAVDLLRVSGMDRRTARVAVRAISTRGAAATSPDRTDRS